MSLPTISKLQTRFRIICQKRVGNGFHEILCNRSKKNQINNKCLKFENKIFERQQKAKVCVPRMSWSGRMVYITVLAAQMIKGSSQYAGGHVCKYMDHKGLAAMLTFVQSAGFTSEVNLRLTQERKHARDLIRFWNPVQTSPEVQNSCISGPTKRSDVLQNWTRKPVGFMQSCFFVLWFPGHHMVCMWKSCGVHVEIMWCLMETMWFPHLKSCGVHLETTWYPHGNHMVSTWKPLCVHMETMWCPLGNHGVHVVTILWFSHGNHMVSTWKPSGIQWKPCGVHVVTMLCPHGNHIVSMWKPCGTHVETMWFSNGNHFHIT